MNTVTLPPGAPSRVLRLLVAVLAVLALALVGAGTVGATAARADTRPADPADPRTPATVSADELPTPQINGVVWSMAMAGNTVYVGGSFTNARPAGAAAGQSTVPRSNLMAFDVTTGAMTSFAPTFNQQIRTLAVSPDGKRLYAGGEFTTVNGQTRQRIAAFDTATGALVSSFAPTVNYHVRAIVATNTKVYVGGNFSGVGSADRRNLAAFDAATGALLDWAPAATGGVVDAITINPAGTKVAVGGGFTALNGSSNPGYGLGMVDAVTGASLPFEANAYVRNGTVDGSIDALTTDGTYIYGGGWTYGKSGGTWEGVFAASWDNGKVRWLNDCHGDTYGVAAAGAVVYAAAHTHYCENIDGMRQGAGGVGDYSYQRAMAYGTQPTGTVSWEPDQGRYYNFAGQPSSAHLGWFPSINAGTYTGQNQGPWSVVANSDYVVMGGEFTRVNGVSQQGLTRFAVSSKAPNKKGPSLFSTTYPINVRSTEAGKVRVNWRTNQDIDNENLTYRVYRNTQNAAGLIHTRTVSSRYWNPFTMGVTDSGLAPGSTAQYRVVVTDPFGNVANSPWTSVTVASSGTDSAYVRAVYADEPTDYWRMGEPSGTTVADTVGFHPLTTGAGVTRGAAGAIAGDGDRAATFSGTNTGWAATTTAGNPPDVFTLETWFRTTSTTGGRILGWSNRNTQGSSSTKHDRQLYMDNTGRIHFGVKPDANRVVVTSPGSYNDGAWHHAVATLSPDGMVLYLDGERVANRSDVTVGEHLSIGHWRIGGDVVRGWPSAPTSQYFAGDIDEVAIYKTALSAADVAAHHAAGAGSEAPNAAPTAAFTTAVNGLGVAVDGRGSTDPDGTIASYAWTFGDGTTATGPQATRTYTAAGTYDVTLTVTDDDGATATLTKQVTVAAANAAPTAAFTTTVTGLSLAVDASTSTDPDGTIASYAWTFGDGTTATGRQATRTYAAAGTYDVTLTVTDDDGATATLTKQVTASTGQAPPLAEDAFARTVANGWGLADVGGSWTTSGTASNYSVAGGLGRILLRNPGAGPGTQLSGLSSTDTDVRVKVGADKAATGGGTYLTVTPRVVSTANRYYVDVRMLSTGQVTLTAGRRASDVETSLQSRTVTGLTMAPGQLVEMRVQAFGTSPTTVRAKVWAAGTPEPATWTVSATDSTAALQAPGTIGLRSYLSGSATNAPVTALFDDLRVGRTQ